MLDISQFLLLYKFSFLTFALTIIFMSSTLIMSSLFQSIYRNPRSNDSSQNGTPGNFLLRIAFVHCLRSSFVRQSPFPLTSMPWKTLAAMRSTPLSSNSRASLMTGFSALDRISFDPKYSVVLCLYMWMRYVVFLFKLKLIIET